MADRLGSRIGPYEVVAALGRGGMALVYKGYDPALDRYVAIKLIAAAYAQDSDFVARFQREARAIARLDHPNIVPVYSFGEHEGTPYLVMKLLNGGTLYDRLGRPWAVPAARAIGDQVGAALDYAHQRGVLHRDIKPANIFFDEGGRAVLGDFGLARLADAHTQLTQAGMSAGTPHYMSPEQALGRELDPRSDLYALGVVLYELLTGRLPFDAATAIGILHAHAYEPPPPPRQYNPAIPPEVEQVILQMLAKDPNDRFYSAAIFVRALDNAASLAAPAGTGLSFSSSPTMLAASRQANNTPAAATPPAAGSPAMEPPAPSHNIRNLILVLGAAVLILGLFIALNIVLRRG